MIKVTIRRGHKNLTRQGLLDRAYELGFNYERYSQSCSQSTVAALHDVLEINNFVVKVATSSAGGQAAQAVGTCGALIGGTMILDYFFGRPAEMMSHEKVITANIDMLFDSIKVAKMLYDKFVKKYGTIICPYIQVQFFGRHYYPLDPDDMEKFEKAGGHSDPGKCCDVVGNTARWVTEILLDKGVTEIP